MNAQPASTSSVHPSISVAMCTYNGARFLPEQLASIASQIELPSEIVVCDDGSTDETIKIINDFAVGAPFPVNVVQNPQKLGPAKNFEKALSMCKGEVIILCDQDDIWFPDKVCKLLGCFSKNPDAGYVFSDAEFVDDQGNQIGQTLWGAVGLTRWPEIATGQQQLQLLLYDNYITGAGMAIRASLAKQASPIAEGWMHDYWIGLIGSALSRGVPISDRLFMYRRHAAQVCGWKKKTYWQSWKISLGADRGGAASKLTAFRKLRAHIINLKSSHAPSAKALRLLDEKEQHLIHRARVRDESVLVRVYRVICEASSGRYFRYSSSPWNSIARDFLP